ncbi:MAG: TIGR04551 family protein, partial [Polyangiaceae bacterium]|nr:TIGR04551 family protein [Polyangiaceae bacterium]
EAEEPAVTEAKPAPPKENTAPAPSEENNPAAPPSSTQNSAINGNPSGAGLNYGLYPSPSADQKALEKQGKERPSQVEEDRIFAEDWWVHSRPTLEMHGYYRLRSQIFSKFDLGRIDSPSSALWPRPADDAYTDLNGTQYGAYVCTPKEAGTGTSDSTADATEACSRRAQMGANMRLRIEPTIVISDNLRVVTQIDLFDNLVLGSTAQGYSNYPAGARGYAVTERSGYFPVSAVTRSQNSPVSGINNFSDSVQVKRVYAEYETPFGQARFGRMPDHFGLGIVHNGGDDIDGDYQSTVDRISFVGGLPSLGLYAAAAWDFPFEGETSQAYVPDGGEYYDAAQSDDLRAVNLIVFRRLDRQLKRRQLKRGKVVMEGGIYLTYAWQKLANDFSGNSATCTNGAAALGCQPGAIGAGYVRRGAKLWTPDIYGELNYRGFHAGFELATNQGRIDNLGTLPGDNDFENPDGDKDGWRVNQWGLAGEITQTLVEDKLKLGFYFGYASGDEDVDGLVPPAGGEEQLGDRTFSTFRFNPGYRIDLILNRHILSRVQGSYYFKPMVQYDFIRKATGMKLGGRAEAIWTRATQFMQTPGHERDLGIELDASIYYQSRDGVLNDDPDLLGGFYAMMQYGVLFPMGGLGYQSEQTDVNGAEPPSLQTAMTGRLFLGVAF